MKKENPPMWEFRFSSFENNFKLQILQSFCSLKPDMYAEVHELILYCIVH